MSDAQQQTHQRPREDCEHLTFRAAVNVHRMRKGDSGPVKVYLTEIAVMCQDCGTPMQYLGIPVGVQYDRPSCGVDRSVVRLACLPEGETLDPEHGLPGYIVEPV